MFAAHFMLLTSFIGSLYDHEVGDWVEFGLSFIALGKLIAFLQWGVN